MKDLAPGNWFNDPMAYDSVTGAQADSQYTLSSVQGVFVAALLVP
jgi:hypothetical protein